MALRAPEGWNLGNLVYFGGFFCEIRESSLKETKFWAATGRCTAGFVLGLSGVLFFDTERAFKPKLVT